jgi:hypothetical protein
MLTTMVQCESGKANALPWKKRCMSHASRRYEPDARVSGALVAKALGNRRDFADICGNARLDFNILIHNVKNIWRCR